MAIGDKLRELRTERAISQNRLHERSGVALSYLRKVEAGEVIPGDENLRKFARTLGADFDELAAERNLTRFERKLAEAVQAIHPERLDTEEFETIREIVIERLAHSHQEEPRREGHYEHAGRAAR